MSTEPTMNLAAVTHGADRAAEFARTDLADALGAPASTPWLELLERVRGLAGTAPEAIARARWSSWRDQRGPSITDGA